MPFHPLSGKPLMVFGGIAILRKINMALWVVGFILGVKWNLELLPI